MTPLARLVAVNLRRDLRGALFCAFGVAVGIGSLVFFTALGTGVNRVVREKIFPSDQRAVEVIPPHFSLSTLLGGGKLDEGAVARLQSLPGVEAAYRKMEVKVPAMAYPAQALAAVGVPMRTSFAAILLGVEPSFVAEDLAPGAAFTDPGPGGTAPVPGLASRRLIELYNSSFAKSQGLPPIPETLLKTIRGVELIDVRLGRSLSGATLPESQFGLSFAGLSDKGPLATILIPLETARRLNQQYQQESRLYSSVTLIARAPDEVPTLSQKVRELGFGLDETARKNSERVGAATAIATSAFALLSVLICLIAGANIAHALSASVRTRAREIALMRAVGATRGDIAKLIIGEAAIIGLAGGLAGALAAWLLGLLIGGLARLYLPELPGEYLHFFAFGPKLFAGAALLGLVAAVAGAVVPARAASLEPPARALAS